MSKEARTAALRPIAFGRRADFAVRVFSVAIIATVPYSIAVSKVRRPFLSDRYFVIVVRLLRQREKFSEPDFALLARAFNRVSMGLWPIRGHENQRRHPRAGGGPRRRKGVDSRFRGNDGGGSTLSMQMTPLPGRRGRTLATQVLRPRPAHRPGIQRKGRTPSPDRLRKNLSTLSF